MNTARIDPSIDKITKDFVGQLGDIYGEDLVSAVLYGSAASGEFVDKYSNINVAVILRNDSLSELTKAIPVTAAKRFKTINAVFFSEDYIKRSLDVFPIEFLDMKENHVVLCGKDVLEGIRVDLKNLRFQCEHELKSKLINLKRLYLKIRDREELKSLLFKSFNSTLHILRNLLRLKGQEPPYSKEETLKALGRAFGVDTNRLMRILDARKDMSKLSCKGLDSLFSDFVDELEKIVTAVDKF